MWSGARLRGRETWAPRNSVRKGLIVMLDSMGVWELNWAFGLGQRVRIGCVMLPYTARDTDIACGIYVLRTSSRKNGSRKDTEGKIKTDGNGSNLVTIGWPGCWAVSDAPKSKSGFAPSRSFRSGSRVLKTAAVDERFEPLPPPPILLCP